MKNTIRITAIIGVLMTMALVLTGCEKKPAKNETDKLFDDMNVVEIVEYEGKIYTLVKNEDSEYVFYNESKEVLIEEVVAENETLQQVFVKYASVIQDRDEKDVEKDTDTLPVETPSKDTEGKSDSNTETPKAPTTNVRPTENKKPAHQTHEHNWVPVYKDHPSIDAKGHFKEVKGDSEVIHTNEPVTNCMTDKEKILNLPEGKGYIYGECSKSQPIVYFGNGHSVNLDKTNSTEEEGWIVGYAPAPDSEFGVSHIPEGTPLGISGYSAVYNTNWWFWYETTVTTPSSKEWVETSPAKKAWRELTGYKCSCGATKGL